jgi:hypothetical protein
MSGVVVKANLSGYTGATVFEVYKDSINNNNLL